MIELGISNIVSPNAKASIFNTSLPSAEANWLLSDITPTISPSYLRIYVCVDTAGILRIVRTTGSASYNVITENLNKGDVLNANAAYLFTIEYRNGDSINIRYSVSSGTIKILRIDEIGGAE